MHAAKHGVALAAAAVALVASIGTVSAFNVNQNIVVPVIMPASIAAQRETTPQSQPVLTNEFLQSYVDRQKQLEAFDAFDVTPEVVLTEEVLSSYIARQRNPALEAIAGAASDGPVLNTDLLASYVEAGYQPTEKKIELADDERLCLTKAIYHEARGESHEGQLAVANIILNRAMSGKYPSTICGVIFQNADKGKYKCQFTFACDGRSDEGTERRAWANSERIAVEAFAEFQQGDTPGVLPSSALFYHTRAVSPSWSHTFQRVAAIGSHLFYAPN